MLLREIKNIFHTELDSLYPKEEVDSFFYMLIEDQLKLERFILAMEPNLIISKEEETPLFDALSGLKLQEPIQHIIGKTHFMNMEFKVNKDVLIPRPETEELVRWIIEVVQSTKFEVRSGNTLRILDIGTGSGCIAISLTKHLNTEVYAIDISEEALKVAEENAKLNEVDITFLKEDILDLGQLEVKFDIIVSNPPYVRELEKKKILKNVLEHEPDLALFVSDDNPLVFYKVITEFASKNLKENGQLFFEINQYLGKETKQLLRDHNFSEIELRKDMFGNERMLKGTLIKNIK
ncbi:peptide chain release factor N(5)-glutamine methyltransferase [Maribacter algarum]|uniref:Release factor glutamine methyltransferase n=1 Tax=Maribacter algarum (ex Zhang et al. 2020) TaxID=2578118 RepID=A0A5S3PH95_9FLAO|nr:peptide chain release factor N(5)-glutamine methyltransferase [Maribacter algarum]TMM53618.1 peptide chain release factor N(5)-glutamine methyltransferase [Maribacter algarum]